MLASNIASMRCQQSTDVLAMPCMLHGRHKHRTVAAMGCGHGVAAKGKVICCCKQLVVVRCAGIGENVARRFAREGFAVGLFSRSREKLDPVEQAIVKAGGRALSVPCDAGVDSSYVASLPQHTTCSGTVHTVLRRAVLQHVLP